MCAQCNGDKFCAGKGLHTPLGKGFENQCHCRTDPVQITSVKMWKTDSRKDSERSLKSQESTRHLCLRWIQRHHCNESRWLKQAIRQMAGQKATSDRSGT